MPAISELKNRLQVPDLPNLAEMDLPRMEQVGRSAGRSADETIDRLLGRSRNPLWNWLAVGLGLAIVAGVIAAYMAWLRRPLGEPAVPEVEWKPETAPVTGWAAEPVPASEPSTSRLDA
jgi:hypothetical protein